MFVRLSKKNAKKYSLSRFRLDVRLSSLHSTRLGGIAARWVVHY